MENLGFNSQFEKSVQLLKEVEKYESITNFSS